MEDSIKRLLIFIRWALKMPRSVRKFIAWYFIGALSDEVFIYKSLEYVC